MREELLNTLVEALAIISTFKQVKAAALERVFVPYMNQYGEIRKRYPDGKLIDVMLDDGIFMQTLLSFTQSVEDSYIKEESSKFPLNRAQDRGTAEALKASQLSLF